MKIKLPKRFYTVDQLAERWECKVEEVEHLIETKMLETADKGAAKEGRKYIRPVLCTDWETHISTKDLQENPHALKVQVYNPMPDAVDGFMEDFFGQDWKSIYEDDPRLSIEKEIARMKAAGDFDQVILASEVSRFEREHGEPTDETAPPASWPWGDYETPLLRILADAVTQFCLDGADKYPKKAYVVNWIKERMKAKGIWTSDSLPGVVETLIAPRPYVPHRQRKQGKP